MVEVFEGKMGYTHSAFPFSFHDDYQYYWQIS